MFRKTASILMAAALYGGSLVGGVPDQQPEGWLLWHSYSDYSAMDSRLFLRSPDGAVTEITGGFVHAMNGSFGSSPADVVFMAIDPAADEWDIFRYNSLTGKLRNLTENSGFRNEDPKFSPDGSKIVFKRGRWDHGIDGFRYDLAEMDAATGEVTMLTDDVVEEAMPCYSADGSTVYFAAYEDGIGSIRAMDRESGEVTAVFGEADVNAYYPAVSGDELFFTRWFDPENRNDMIVRSGGGEIVEMPFDSTEFNCSDACPIGGNEMIYSSTENGSYDLFYFDGVRSHAVDGVNSEKNELGAAFYPVRRAQALADELRGFLLGEKAPELDLDIDGDGKVDCFDMICARRFL